MVTSFNSIPNILHRKKSPIYTLMMTFSAFIIIFFAENLISAHTHDNPSTKLIGQEQQQKVKGINYGGRFIPENWMS